jgi:hypothetical protein
MPKPPVRYTYTYTYTHTHTYTYTYTYTGNVRKPGTLPRAPSTGPAWTSFHLQSCPHLTRGPRCHDTKFVKPSVSRHKVRCYLSIYLPTYLPIHTYIHTYVHAHNLHSRSHNNYVHTFSLTHTERGLAHHAFCRITPYGRNCSDEM